VTLTSLFGYSVLATVLVVGQVQPQPWRNVVVPGEGFDKHEIKVPLPRTEATCQLVLRRTIEAARIPVGFVSIADPPDPPGVRSRPSPRLLQISGRSVGDVLADWQTACAGYDVTDDGKTANIVTGDGEAFLDQPVPAFTVKAGTLATTLLRVHQLFDPEYPASAAPTVSERVPEGFATPDQAPVATQAFNKPFSLSAPAGTLRALLNAIVEAHGGAYWEIKFRRRPVAYSVAEIGFGVFEGKYVSLPARALVMK
jgi:hypothetical protein